MNCADLQANAAGLASLPLDAAERKEAVEHAGSCDACRAALAEGEALMRVLEDAQPVPVLRPEVMARAKAQILAELGMDVTKDDVQTAQVAGRPSTGWRSTAALLAVVAGSYLLPLAGGRRLTGPNAPFSLSLAVAAAVVTGLALVWGGVLFAAIPLASALASFLAGGAGPLGLPIGVKCLLMEVAMSLPALAAAAALAWRRSLPWRTRSLIAAAGGGALAGQAALGVLCHAEPSHAHLFTFHTGGVVLALGLGVLAARLLVRIRATSG